ncbi:MAG: hypothetical protein EBS27_03455 [Actinobacteria bacterium]|nr:hypothetical protein [Actinomycetota bacterium]
MSSLPPPDQSQSLRAGTLTKSWVIAVVVTHLLIAGSLVALATSALAVGKPTWWLASQTNGPFSILAIVPFLAPAAVIIAAVRASRFAALAGLLATALLAIVSVVDISRSPGIALGEAILAGCTALTTIAAIAGRRRAVASGF